MKIKGFQNRRVCGEFFHQAALIMGCDRSFKAGEKKRHCSDSALYRMRSVLHAGSSPVQHLKPRRRISHVRSQAQFLLDRNGKMLREWEAETDQSYWNKQSWGQTSLLFWFGFLRCSSRDSGSKWNGALYLTHGINFLLRFCNIHFWDLCIFCW